MGHDIASMSPGDLEYACHELARILKLDRPVPVSVLLRAAREPGYREQMIACGGDARCLIPLLSLDDPEPHPSRELAVEALKAFWSWGGAGFGVVDAATYRKRLGACRSCPHYGQAPPRAIYQLAGVWAGDSRICKKCGCVMSVKARLFKQGCPSRDPESPARSRWGEPYDD